eukprot:30872-Pelagococcus_subviridis.AAC.3
MSTSMTDRTSSDASDDAFFKSRYSSCNAHRSKNVPATSSVPTVSVTPSTPPFFDPLDAPSVNPPQTFDLHGSVTATSRNNRTAITLVDAIPEESGSSESGSGSARKPRNPAASLRSGDDAMIPRAAPTPVAMTTTSASCVSSSTTSPSRVVATTRDLLLLLSPVASSTRATRRPPKTSPPTFSISRFHGAKISSAIVPLHQRTSKSSWCANTYPYRTSSAAAALRVEGPYEASDVGAGRRSGTRQTES